MTKKNEEEEKEINDSINKEFDEAAGIELREISRDNLFNSSGKNIQSEQLKNQ